MNVNEDPVAKELASVLPEPLEDQLDLLRSEHRELDETIARICVCPPDDELALRRLKKRKLALKDRICALERQLEPDEYA